MTLDDFITSKNNEFSKWVEENVKITSPLDDSGWAFGNSVHSKLGEDYQDYLFSVWFKNQYGSEFEDFVTSGDWDED